MAKPDRREAILKAAEALFLSQRFDRVTLDDVRRKAHVGKGTIYQYFKDKEDLYGQVILCGLDALRHRLEGELAAARSPEQQLLAAAGTLMEFYRRRFNLFRSAHAEYLRGVIKSRALHGELHERRRATAELIASVIAQGQRAGAFRDDVPAYVAARMFLSAARAAAGGAFEHGESLGADTVVELFLNGMRGEKR